MLLQQSGSDLLPRHQSRIFRIDESTQVGEARRAAALLCDELGFSETRKGRVAIVVNELGHNLVKYGQNGQLILRATQMKQRRGIEILSIDEGPGFISSQQVMADGFTTGSTPGTGLGAVRRQSDQFDIYSILSKGTVVFSHINSEDDFEASEKSDYQVGAICRALQGETLCGDGWEVIPGEQGELQILVVDGLGHGIHAHQASIEAMNEFEKSLSQPQELQVRNIHGRLKSTRGAAIFLVSSKNGSEVVFSGVGNIRCFLQSPMGTKTLISQNGTAGLQMRSVRALNQAWDPNSILVVHTDGLQSRWDFTDYENLLGHHPAIYAGLAYRDFQRKTDDSTIVVVRKHR